MAENLNTLYYALELDDIKMQQELKKAIDNLSTLDDEFNRINKTIEETFGKKIKDTPVQKEIKGLTARLRELENEWKNLEAAERRGTRGQQIRADYEKLRKEAGNLNNSLARLYSESQKAASGQKGLAAQIGLVNKELTLQNRLASNIKTLFTTYISIFAVKSFIQNLAQVRGEFELQQISLRAILRDAEAADRIFSQIKSFAVISPFEFKDLVGYAKQLSAFQVPVNELFETTKRLADVSAGLGVGMDRIILAYGQVRSAAVLRGQELRQFTEAGIPLVDELAKKFSELEGRVVSAGEVFEKISNRMVSFEMVKEIFEDMTNESGMFYMMQEKQAESLKGKIANLADAYAIMLNDIGQANDGILKGGVEGIAALMRNWEKVWSILKTIIAGYGLYKAAIIAATVAEKAHIALGTSGSLLKTAKNLVFVIQNLRQYRTALEATGMTARSFGAAMGGIIGILAAIGVAIYEVIQNSNKLSNELNKISSDEFSGFRKMADSLEDLSGKLKNTVQGSQEHRDIIRQINNAYGEYLPFVLDEKTALDAVANSTEQVIEAMKKRKMMMAQEKGEQAIEESYGTDLADARKDLTDFLSKLSVSKKDAMAIVQLLEQKMKETEATASLPDLYKVVREYFGKDIFGNLQTGLDFRKNLEELIDVIEDIKKAERELADQTSITFGFSFSTQRARIEFEKLEASYAKMREELKKKPLDKDEFEQELTKIDKQEKIAKINFKVEFEGLSTEKAKEQIKALEEISVRWKEIVKDTIGKNKAGFIFKVSEGESQFDYLDRLDKEYKKIKAQQDLIENGLITSPETIESTKTQLSLLEQIGKALNYNFKVDKKELKKEDAQQIQLLNKELALIEKAKDDYDKLIKLQSKSDANQNIKTIYGIDFNEKDVEARTKDIISKITAISKTEGEKTQKSFDKWFARDQTSEIIDNLKKTFDAITKELDTYKDKYNFYEQLLGITGDQNLAVNLAFNGNFEKVGEGIVGQIKQGMVNAALNEGSRLTIDEILNLDFSKSAEELGISEKLKDFLQKSVDEIGKIQVGNILDFQKLIAEYSSVEDKIKSIQSRGAAERTKISQTYAKLREGVNQKMYAALEEQEAAAINASKQKEDKAINDLESQLLQLSDFWKKIFGDISNMSYKSLAELGNQANEILKNAKEQKDKDGKITGYRVEIDGKSYDFTIQQMERLRKKMIEVYNTASDKNPFAALFDGFKKGKADGEDSIAYLNRLNGDMQDAIAITDSWASSLSEIFDSLGNEKIAEDISFAMEQLKGGANAAMGIARIASGDVVGGIGQALTGISGIVKSITQRHDNKLEKQIQESILAIQKLQGVYSELERMISRNLGGAQNLDLGIEYSPERLAEINNQLDILRTKSKNNILFKIKYSSNIKELEKEQRKLQAYSEGGVYAVQRDNLIRQQEELMKQRQAEIDKKKTDQSKVLDYENQIKELDDAIRYFAEDTLKNLYDIDLKDWASQIGDSLVDAFSRGEDAAAAFDRTIGDLMRSVTKKMVSLNILEPMFERLRTYLFGSDGKSGAFGGDFKLDAGEIAGMKTYIDEIKNKGIPASQELYDAINKALGGIMDLGEGSGGSLTKGIQGVTENTANIIGSYINAIRSSAALQEVYQKNIDTNVSAIYRAMSGSTHITTTIPPEIIAAISEPFHRSNSLLASIDTNMSNVHSIAANALAQLVMIQANTYNTAMATRDAVDELRGVISPGHPRGGSGIKVWV